MDNKDLLFIKKTCHSLREAFILNNIELVRMIFEWCVNIDLSVFPVDQTRMNEISIRNFSTKRHVDFFVHFLALIISKTLKNLRSIAYPKTSGSQNT